MLMTRAEKLILENQKQIMTAMSVLFYVLPGVDETMLRADLTKSISKTLYEINHAKHLTGDTP